MPKVDPNLRKVLDTLSEAGVEHPTQDLDILRSVLDRLDPDRKIRAERGAPRIRAAPEPETVPAVAAPEAAPGHLSLMVEEAPDEVVAFERVDLTGLESGPLEEDDELLEFETLAPAPPSWSDQAPAWDDDAAWEEPATWAEGAEVEWDDDVEGVDGDTETYADDETGGTAPIWEAPGTAEVTDAWEDVAPPHDAASGGPEDAPWGEADMDLDDRTQADLRELEAQLASLEAEMDRRRAAEQKKT